VGIITSFGPVRKSANYMHFSKIYMQQPKQRSLKFYEIHFGRSLSKYENLLRQCTYALAEAKTVLY
jgi:hypothetical protein